MGSVWRDARTIEDLGVAMADWLEGRIPSWPGYYGPFGQEEENGARHLIPTLVALNRAGFVTTNSQPGMDGRDHDGSRWRQRAWVEGVVDDRSPLLDRLVQSAERAGMTVIRGRRTPQPVILTDRNGEPMSSIGHRYPRNQLAREWNGVGRHALRALRDHGAPVAFVDLVWGRDDRLWPTLRTAA
jgi:hypothetical protein